MSAGAPEGERPVLVPLHLVQEIENPVGRLGLDGVFLPVGLVVDLRVVAPDPERDVHRSQYTLGFGSNLVIVTGLYRMLMMPDCGPREANVCFSQFVSSRSG